MRQRAEHLCEYCHTSEDWQYVRFTIDHFIPVSDGGTNAPDNLALACFHCNRRKADKREAFDHVTKQTIALFHPRRTYWCEHFMWSADKLHIIALTATGQATIELLQLNRERNLHIRQADVSVNRHPPADDPVESPEVNES